MDMKEQHRKYLMIIDIVDEPNQHISFSRTFDGSGFYYDRQKCDEVGTNSFNRSCEIKVIKKNAQHEKDHPNSEKKEKRMIWWLTLCFSFVVASSFIQYYSTWTETGVTHTQGRTEDGGIYRTTLSPLGLFWMLEVEGSRYPYWQFWNETHWSHDSSDPYDNPHLWTEVHFLSEVTDQTRMYDAYICIQWNHTMGTIACASYSFEWNHEVFQRNIGVSVRHLKQWSFSSPLAYSSVWVSPDRSSLCGSDIGTGQERCLGPISETWPNASTTTHMVCVRVLHVTCILQEEWLHTEGLVHIYVQCGETNRERWSTRTHIVTLTALEHVTYRSQFLHLGFFDFQSEYDSSFYWFWTVQNNTVSWWIYDLQRNDIWKLWTRELPQTEPSEVWSPSMYHVGFIRTKVSEHSIVYQLTPSTSRMDETHLSTSFRVSTFFCNVKQPYNYTCVFAGDEYLWYKFPMPDRILQHWVTWTMDYLNVSTEFFNVHTLLIEHPTPRMPIWLAPDLYIPSKQLWWFPRTSFNYPLAQHNQIQTPRSIYNNEDDISSTVYPKLEGVLILSSENILPLYHSDQIFPVPFRTDLFDTLSANGTNAQRMEFYVWTYTDRTEQMIRLNLRFLTVQTATNIQSIQCFQLQSKEHTISGHSNYVVHRGYTPFLNINQLPYWCTCYADGMYTVYITEQENMIFRNVYSSDQPQPLSNTISWLPDIAPIETILPTLNFTDGSSFRWFHCSSMNPYDVYIAACTQHSDSQVECWFVENVASWHPVWNFSLHAETTRWEIGCSLSSPNGYNYQFQLFLFWSNGTHHGTDSVSLPDDGSHTIWYFIEPSNAGYYPITCIFSTNNIRYPCWYDEAHAQVAFDGYSELYLQPVEGLDIQTFLSTYHQQHVQAMILRTMGRSKEVTDISFVDLYPCAPGTLRKTKISWDCTIVCPMGFYCPTENDILPCPADTFSPSSGQAHISSCVSCPALWSTGNQTGQSACLVPNFDQIPYTPAGSYYHTSSKQVLPCAAGSYQPTENQTWCIPCPTGHSQPNQGSVTCPPCTPGSFAAKTGMESCVLCPAGWYMGYDNSAFCIPCAPGSSQSREGATSCDDCNQGTYQPERNATSCRACESGTYTSSSQSVRCMECLGRVEQQRSQCVDVMSPPGMFFRLADETFQFCPRGTYSLGGSYKNNSCTECPPFTATLRAGQTSCFDCRTIEGIICTNGEVHVQAGYWAWAEDTDMRPQVYPCSISRCTNSYLFYHDTTLETPFPTKSGCGGGHVQQISRENALCRQCPANTYQWSDLCLSCSSEEQIQMWTVATSFSFLTILVFHWISQRKSDQALPIVIFYFHTLSRMLPEDHWWQVFAHLIGGNTFASHESGSNFNIFSRCWGSWSVQSKMFFQIGMVGLTWAQWGLFFFIATLRKRYGYSVSLTRWWKTLGYITLFGYDTVAFNIFQSFYCTSMYGHSFLYHQPNESCPLPGLWIWAVLWLVVLLLGCPLLCILLHKHPKYGPLVSCYFEPFIPRWQQIWFVWQFLRKLILIIILTYSPTNVTLPFSLLMLVALAFQHWIQPYKLNLFNTMEQTSLMSLLLTSILLLAFPNITQWNPVGAGWFGISCILTLLYLLISMLYGKWMEYITEKIRKKQEAWLDQFLPSLPSVEEICRDVSFELS